GIHACYYMPDHWMIEYNEIALNRYPGIVISGSSLIQKNYIHHNTTIAGYVLRDQHQHLQEVLGDDKQVVEWVPRTWARSQRNGEPIAVQLRRDLAHGSLGRGTTKPFFTSQGEHSAAFSCGTILTAQSTESETAPYRLIPVFHHR